MADGLTLVSSLRLGAECDAQISCRWARSMRVCGSAQARATTSAVDALPIVIMISVELSLAERRKVRAASVEGRKEVS
jgi:hypothetical protein